MSKGLPGLSHVDHVGLTVPDLDAAVRFYCDVIGGHELYRIGPFDAAEMPRMSDGRDWTRGAYQRRRRPADHRHAQHRSQPDA